MAEFGDIPARGDAEVPVFRNTERDIPLLAITGGGSGGHTMPAIAVAQHAIHRGEATVVYIGSANGIEREVAEAAGLSFETIRTGKLRRSTRWSGYFQRQNVEDVFNVAAGVIDSLKILRRLRPDAVLGTGGYVSVPVIVAAAVLRIPRTIHEQTVVFGLANRLTHCALEQAFTRRHWTAC